MALFLLLAFILVPIIEIATFIEVGGWIGLWPTLAVVVATAVAGTWLLRLQGMATLARGRAALANQVFPADALFDGLCLVVAGALLLTPGFVTDAIGLLLFLPPIRAWLRHLARRHLVQAGATWTWHDGPEGETIE
ncbi:MAG: FxsA family protein, partial [Alphaproteobacteria bacterium]